MKKSLVCFFFDTATNLLFMGQIVHLDKESALFDRLEVVTTPYPSIENAGRSECYNHLFVQSIYTNAKKDAIGNPIVRKSRQDRITRILAQVALVETLNIQPRGANYIRDQ